MAGMEIRYVAEVEGEDGLIHDVPTTKEFFQDFEAGEVKGESIRNVKKVAHWPEWEKASTRKVRQYVEYRWSYRGLGFGGQLHSQLVFGDRVCDIADALATQKDNSSFFDDTQLPEGISYWERCVIALESEGQSGTGRLEEVSKIGASV